MRAQRNNKRYCHQDQRHCQARAQIMSMALLFRQNKERQQQKSVERERQDRDVVGETRFVREAWRVDPVGDRAW